MSKFFSNKTGMPAFQLTGDAILSKELYDEIFQDDKKICKNSGDISFFDPKEMKTYRFPEIKKNTDYSVEKITIKSEEGDLLIFPSYLYHDVEKNLTNEERIVVSFNIDVGY